MDEQKEEERQAHLQRRMEASRAGRGHLDPYRQNVARSASEATDEPPRAPFAFTGMHVFYSGETAPVLLRKIEAAFMQLDLDGKPTVILKEESAKVNGSTPPVYEYHTQVLRESRYFLVPVSQPSSHR